MSPGRRLFFLSVCGLALVWSVLSLNVSITRFAYRNMIEAIRVRDELPNTQELAEAIADYDSTLEIASCNAALHADMTLLLSEHTDAAMAAGTADEDAALQQTQEELATRLSCSPTDGKAWLDFATLDIYREGFTDTALGAYRMSALVAPGESWLAQKRLLFALQFHPLFDAAAMKVAKADLAVLKQAHPNRMVAVMKVAGVPNEPALYAMFATTPKAQ